jgi:di/tripeptidase
MKNLNAEQIKKALKCCHTPLASDCNDCGYRGQSVENGEYIGCSNRLMADALALLNELTEENKAWQMQLLSQEEKAGKAYYDLACEVEDLRAENENLHASCTELTQSCTKLTEENERLRAELVQRPPKLIITKLPKKENENV